METDDMTERIPNHEHTAHECAAHECVTHECDVLVIGSGVSGYCAAIQAGREGCRTILVEKDEVLGGNSGPNLGVGITGADRHAAYGTETGIIQELQEEAAWVRGFTQLSKGTVPYSISRRNEAVVQHALESAGVTILKRHFAQSPIMDGNRITGVIAVDTAAFRTVEIRVAGVVIEASGDGHIGAMAGADFDVGSEAADEYAERSAPDERRSWVQGTSLVAIAHKTDHPVEYIPPPDTPEFVPRLWHGRMATHVDHHRGEFAGDKTLKFMYMTEAGGDIDTISDDGEIYEELLKQLWAEWNHIKNGPHREEAEYWDLLWVSPKAGKRESRRFLGDVVLTQQDLEAGRRFADDIAYGGHDLDDHQSLGAAGSNIFGHSIPPMYGIPFRACYSRSIDNLLLAGRLISATHLAHSSTRVMRTGAAIGQAVGLAAALCCEHGLTPRDLHDQRISELQQTLLRRDGTILGEPVGADGDLARDADVKASSEVRFNDQQVEHMAPLVATAGNLLHDWPERITELQFYLKNDSPVDQTMALTVYHSRRDPGWTTAAQYGRQRWNDLADSAFSVVTERTFVLPGGFDGWHTVQFDKPIKLEPRDPASDADRIIVSLGENRSVWWGLMRSPIEICDMVEHSHHEPHWQQISAMASMRFTPEIPLGDASSVTNGYHRRFSRGPTNMWMSSDPLPQNVTLTWKQPVEFNHVEITLDNLAAERSDNSWESGERVMPTLAKTYELAALVDGEWVVLAQEECNIHRFRTHVFDSVTTDQLRLTITENHGDGGVARVYRVGVYKQ
jgi:hypothetical protein